MKESSSSGNPPGFDVFSIPESQHGEFSSKMADAASVAVADFPSNVGQLIDILERLDCPVVLANFSFFGLHTTIDEEGRFDKVMPHILLHHAELLQAVSLTIGANKWPGHQSIDEMEAVFNLVEVMAKVPAMKYTMDNLEKTHQSSAVQDLLLRMRMNTQVVRHWDYYQDAIEAARNLYSPLEVSLRARLGFSVGELLTLASTMKSLVEDRMEKYRTMLYEVVSADTEKGQLARYFDWYPEPEDTSNSAFEALESRSIDVAGFVISRSSLRLPDIYTFDIPTLSAASGVPAPSVDAILRSLALKPGDLVGSNLEHLFLQNPVWLQPIIDIGKGQFMAPLVEAIFSHLHLIVKRLAGQGRVARQLDKRRSEYLEGEVPDVLREAMPGARIFPNKKWPWRGAEFETDCLAIFDRTLLIVEAKSSRLTQDALRGAPGTLKKMIEKVVLNPSLQSERLLAVLEGAKRGDKRSVATLDHLHIDPKEIDLAIRLSITLDDMSIMYTAEQLLKEANWIPSDHRLPVTMTIHDFRHVVHILDNPIFLFHYLHERYFVQKRWATVEADELDLLGVYLRTGMNIAQVPANKSDVLILTGESDAIDRHYSAREAGFYAGKPRPRLRPLFWKIIRKLSIAEHERRIIIGRHVLSCADYDEQKVVEGKLVELRRIVRRTWRDEKHECSLVVTPPENRKAPVVFYLYPKELYHVSRERAADVGAQVLNDTGRDECCVIVRSIEDWGNPYEAVLLLWSRS